eukprot:CAMPEP_0194154254 /NCGR_PEP_ID=MMETSP0152-20130528/59902_1 /TAXON_ID=1049557 /ORGANISM="Thalassiothrix antarctica, Strain L6-D1" /LENGTH=72 /DNA_ID=CAMNT_0038860205 /DNA_START=47 /DNA_END=261 /DNA_ORIENTATION=-
MTTLPGNSHRLARGFLDRVRHNDRAGTAARSALPFVIGQTPVGLVLPLAAQEFSKFPSVFSVTSDEIKLLDR